MSNEPINGFDGAYLSTPLGSGARLVFAENEPLPDVLPGLVNHVLAQHEGKYQKAANKEYDRSVMVQEAAFVCRRTGLTRAQTLTLLKTKHHPSIGLVMEKGQDWFDRQFPSIVEHLDLAHPHEGKTCTLECPGISDNDRTALILNEKLKTPPADPFDIEVKKRLEYLRVDEEARRLLRAEKVAAQPIPAGMKLTDLLTITYEDAVDLIEKLLPKDGNAFFFAQAKAGKTTFLNNLIRALVDELVFLGKYQVAKLTGNVGVINLEMSERKNTQWLRDLDIKNTDRVRIWNLRGQASLFDMRDPARRKEWALRLNDEGVTVLTWDCMKPVVKSLGLSEDKDLGLLLYGFTEMLLMAGVSESVVVHHAGWNPAHSIGDSSVEGWADAIWSLSSEEKEVESLAETGGKYINVKQKTKVRSFAAKGRDVEVYKTKLHYDPFTRLLTLQENPSSTVERQLFDFVKTHGGTYDKGIVALRNETKLGKDVLDAAIDALGERDLMSVDTTAKPHVFTVAEEWIEE
ncbi:AAA family ATPase [Dactylosporangium sp. NPDC005572]|uniref:AAA family ATPase n=1 Tax=Dactylosporangium sp. NPDC005572 TaxID=3156889 RepID=UPI0033A7D0D0